MTTARAYGGRRGAPKGYDPDAWGTPQWLFDELDAEFHFNLDVCASEENAKCEQYLSVEDNGLVYPWREARRGPVVAWLNPPFSQVEEWLKKAYGEATMNGVTTVCLVKADTSTRWFRRFYPLASEVRFLKRIQFIPPPGYPGKVGSPNMGHALLIFRGAK
jgi:phage N-6-adenine-methyltransferase